MEKITIEKVAHDICGQLCNLRGFHMELDSAVDELVSIIESYHDQLPMELKKTINAIIDDDIKPCLKFSNSSITNLNTRLNQFKQKHD